MRRWQWEAAALSVPEGSAYKSPWFRSLPEDIPVDISLARAGDNAVAGLSGLAFQRRSDDCPRHEGRCDRVPRSPSAIMICSMPCSSGPRGIAPGVTMRRLLPGCKSASNSTSREREVMAPVVTGRMNMQIAADLFLSEVTVKLHRGNVMRKMPAKSLAELVRIADRLGLSPAPKS